ncbi:MAG TPA: inositol monophosphatase, partial [Clostridiales bacterium]|nr:inositol monophosphatase [Clostridiales bacterium]
MIDPFIVPAKIKAAVPSIIREAGRLILSRQDQGLQFTEKSDKNFVTEIDLDVEQLIVRNLKALTPDYAVITEEAAGNRFIYDRPTWILDPVDGTTNLMRNCRHSAISLALAADGHLRQGYIFNPWLDELFAAESGGGARLNGRPIRSSQRSALSDCLVGFGTTPYERTDAHRTFV